MRGSTEVWFFMLSVASAHIALPVNFSSFCFPWRRERHGTATTAVRFSLPPEEGLGEGKHCREVFYVICGFSVFCAPD